MDKYIELAKLAVDTFFQQRKIIDLPENFPNNFYKEKAGVFVTIYNGFNLRGCIGTYEPTQENLGKEIIANAVAAATKDYRFNSITEEELPSLKYEISILSQPVKIKDKKELDPKKFGILVKSNGKSALLLPDLEGINTVEQQLSAVCQKAGISYPEEKIEIYKFSIEKHV